VAARDESSEKGCSQNQGIAVHNEGARPRCHQTCHGAAASRRHLRRHSPATATVAGEPTPRNR
jgi:hypothetical protein